ncbi:MAG: alanyl-tRNA editing protein [Gemmatimonadota bacterium]
MELETLPAYERDPRQVRLETEVLETGEQDGRPYVVLTDTVLYPEGGGQPADRGTVAGVAVLDVQRVEGRIRHVLAGPAPSGPVRVELDWARRFDHMQQHTAQHLLTAVADTRHGWHTTAFHLGEDVSDIELDVPGLSSAQVADLEEAVAAEVRAARPVTARRVDAETYATLPVRSRGLPAGHTGSIRLVEIDGIDLNTCGGTHCASTAELEAVKLLGTEPVRGGTRLFYVAGGRMRRTLGAHHARAAALRGVLGVGDSELVGAVEAKLAQLKEAHRSVRALEEELAVATAERFAAAGHALWDAHFPERGLPFLQRIARELERMAPAAAAFLTCGPGEEGAFVLAAGPEATLDLPRVGPAVAEALGGRGGGSGRLYQGKASRLSGRAEALARVLSASSPH